MTDHHLAYSLIDAVCSGREEKVRHLLEDSRTNVMTAEDHLGYSTLHCASQNGHVDMINVLLAKAEEEEEGRARRLLINDKHYRNGWTALHYACYYGHVEAVQLLLKKGADATIQDKDGRTAFQVARNNRCCFRNVGLPAAKNITEKNGNKTPQASNRIETNASKDEKDDALSGMISELKEEKEALKRQLWTEKAAAWKKRNELLAARNKEMEHNLDTLEAQNDSVLDQKKLLNAIVEQRNLEVSTLRENLEQKEHDKLKANDAILLLIKQMQNERYEYEHQNAKMIQQEQENRSLRKEIHKLRSKRNVKATSPSFGKEQTDNEHNEYVEQVGVVDASLADELVAESLRTLAAIGNALENQQHYDEPMDGAAATSSTKIKLVMKQVAALKTNLEAYYMKNEKDG